MNTPWGVLKPRHFLGRWLRRVHSEGDVLAVMELKRIFFGKKLADQAIHVLVGTRSQEA